MNIWTPLTVIILIEWNWPQIWICLLCLCVSFYLSSFLPLNLVSCVSAAADQSVQRVGAASSLLPVFFCCLNMLLPLLHLRVYVFSLVQIVTWGWTRCNVVILSLSSIIRCIKFNPNPLVEHVSSGSWFKCSMSSNVKSGLASWHQISVIRLLNLLLFSVNCSAFKPSLVWLFIKQKV